MEWNSDQNLASCNLHSTSGLWSEDLAKDNFQIDPSVTGDKRSNFSASKESTASKKHSKKSTKPPSKNFFSSNILESIGALVIRYSTGIRVFWDKGVAILYSL